VIFHDFREKLHEQIRRKEDFFASTPSSLPNTLPIKDPLRAMKNLSEVTHSIIQLMNLRTRKAKTEQGMHEEVRASWPSHMQDRS